MSSIWTRVKSVPRLQKEVIRLEQELQRAQQRIKMLEDAANAPE
jgi:hypothetical protein